MTLWYLCPVHTAVCTALHFLFLLRGHQYERAHGTALWAGCDCGALGDIGSLEWGGQPMGCASGPPIGPMVGILPSLQGTVGASHRGGWPQSGACRGGCRHTGIRGVVDHSAWRRRTCCGLEGPKVQLPCPVGVLHPVGSTVLLEDRTAISAAHLYPGGLQRRVAGSLYPPPAGAARHRR